MCRHQFHDIIMHSFPDIDEIRVFDNDGPHLRPSFAYTYMHIHKTTCLTMKNICVDTICEML